MQSLYRWGKTLRLLGRAIHARLLVLSLSFRLRTLHRKAADCPYKVVSPGPLSNPYVGKHSDTLGLTRQPKDHVCASKTSPSPPFAAASAGPSVLSSIRYTRATRGSAVSLRPGHCCVNQAQPASRHRSQAPKGAPCGCVRTAIARLPKGLKPTRVVLIPIRVVGCRI